MSEQRWTGEFHWRDGWYFKRMDDEGTVRIRQEGGATVEIPPAEWASIIHAVGPVGSDFSAILSHHTGEI